MKKNTNNKSIVGKYEGMCYNLRQNLISKIK
jgi:hypothetical protein